MNQFERYACQMALPGFGESAQQALRKARVLIVGAGGLGCPAAQYLVAAGLGTVGLADDDRVSLSNLHRQLLYSPDDVGNLKVVSACKKLRLQNPSVRLIPVEQRVRRENVMDLIAGYDLVIDGTDNFETKYLLNDACVLSGKPLVYGAIYQYEGQVSVWNVPQKDGSFSANYRDVFPDADQAQIPNCAEGGVIPTLAGIIGCMQAGEAIKYFTHPGDVLAGKLWMIDVQRGESQTIHYKNQITNQITCLPESVDLIDEEELEESRKHLHLIDVRSEAERRQFHIGGEHIPLEDLPGALSGRSFEQPLVFYCASGIRSAAAVRRVKQRFPQLTTYSLKGGVNSLEARLEPSEAGSKSLKEGKMH